MKKLFFSLICFFIFFSYKSVDASDTTYLYVSGTSLGIKLQTRVEVLGTFGVNDGNSIQTPWEGLLEEHDIILKCNNNIVNSASDFINEVETSKGSTLNLLIKRNDEEMSINIKPVLNVKKKYSVGLYIKDYEMGIGTLSFVDKTSLRYASLGHQLINKEINGGSIYQASVKEIILPRDNQAGNKRADIIGTSIGNVKLNTVNGVYGVLTDSNVIKNSTMVELGKKEEVHVGSAYILTSVKSTTIEKYEIEITETKKQNESSTKGLKFKVTDDELLEKTGGIIQGMSGSPIIQDGKVVGAVTHVVLKDASLGYGCYAEFMYQTMMKM